MGVTRARPFVRALWLRVGLVLSVLSAAGCLAGGAAPAEDSGLYGDRDPTGMPQCGPDSESPTDQACHEDCTRDCGFTHPLYPRALKYCVCQAGVFIECRCPRPEWYQGAREAPYCDPLTSDGSGRTSFINDTPCDAEWDQCVARDEVDGFTPRGCVCVRMPNDTLRWECGSTEKWFYPEQSVHD